MVGRARHRTYVYVDGFNLYYGVLKGSAHRWLNPVAYFDAVLQHDDVVMVRYFTAMARGASVARQRTYLRALQAQERLQVILGKYKTKKVQCGVQNCRHSGGRFFEAPEEKRTDVNIAVWMLRDAFSGVCDRQVLVTGDSDLVPALEAVRAVCPGVLTRVYVPTPSSDVRAATELRSRAHDSRNLPLAELKKAHLPQVVQLEDGTKAEKPAGW
ncbi:MAG: NYN domain-containing protein [Planctomycetota bacterium]